MRKIRIYFNHKPWGKANSFIKSLYSALQQTGQVEFAEDIEDDYSILFLDAFKEGIASSPERTQSEKVEKYQSVRADSSGKKKIFVRAVNLKRHSRRFGFLYWFRDVAKIKLVNTADMVIFQSYYQKGFFTKYGYKGKNNVVIHNGADTDIFSDKGNLWDGKENLKIVSCSLSSHPVKRHDLITKVSECKGVEVSHIGDWPDSVDEKNVKLLGVLGREEVADVLKRSHVFLHPAVKDVCPNVVFEAICCGLPVIYNDSIGSSAEIVKDNGVALNIKNPQQTIEQVKENYFDLKQKVKSSSHYYSIDRVAKQYSDVFREVSCS
jgi:glycosyltransferase involved in cell wall biosynthesis